MTSVGQEDGERCATMVAADRDLKRAGYEVFRFGAEELQSEDHSQVKVFSTGCSISSRCVLRAEADINCSLLTPVDAASSHPEVRATTRLSPHRWFEGG
jgi:hypothetical protein